MDEDNIGATLARSLEYGTGTPLLVAADRQLRAAEAALGEVADPAVRDVLDRLVTASALVWAALSRHQFEAHRPSVWSTSPRDFRPTRRSRTSTRQEARR